MLKQSKISFVVLEIQPPLRVEVIRERRRSLSLRILSGVHGRMKVPMGYTDALALTFLQKKESWILRQINRLNQHAQPPSDYFSGTVISYLGEPLQLQISYRDMKYPKIALMGDKLVLEGSTAMLGEDRHGAILKWLRARASDVFVDRVGLYADQIGKYPTQIRVKILRSKWGSCSSLGAINLRWNLIMAPLWILDYVVIHELCHLYFPHHRPSFWALVAVHCPNYLAAKQWLKDYGESLELPTLSH